MVYTSIYSSSARSQHRKAGIPSHLQTAGACGSTLEIYKKSKGAMLEVEEQGAGGEQLSVFAGINLWRSGSSARSVSEQVFWHHAIK